MSGSKSLLCLLSRADISRVNYSPQGRDVCEYAYPASKLTILRSCAPEVLSVQRGGVPGRDGIGPGVCCLRQLGRGAPVPLHLQHVCGFFGVPFWHGRHPGVWF